MCKSSSIFNLIIVMFLLFTVVGTVSADYAHTQPTDNCWGALGNNWWNLADSACTAGLPTASTNIALHGTVGINASTNAENCKILYEKNHIVPKVILDTDMGSDCDDAGAMAVLHKLADRGEVEILGVIYSSGKNKYGVGVCDAINTYYGRGDLLLGQNLNDDVGDPRDSYSKKIATDVTTYRHDVIDSAMDMVSAYKIMLEKEQDASVTIITVGHPIGLVHLLRDDEGARLVKSKVSRWVAMGGGGWILP